MTTATQRSQARSGNSTHQSTEDEATAFVDQTTETVQAVAEKVQHEAEHIAELAKDGFDRAKEVHGSTCEKVKKHPTAAVLLAVGAGVLIGRLFH